MKETYYPVIKLYFSVVNLYSTLKMGFFEISMKQRKSKVENRPELMSVCSLYQSI